jgi:hypothetical protein
MKMTLYEWLYTRVTGVEDAATDLIGSGIEYMPTLSAKHNAFTDMLGDIPVGLAGLEK